MSEITRVCIDTSKSVLTIHAVDAQDRPVPRRNLRRQDMVPLLRHLWLHVRCRGTAMLPLRAATRPGILADYLMALRRKQRGAPPRVAAACGSRVWQPRVAMVIDEPAQATRRPYDGPEGWQLIVVGRAEDDLPPVVRLLTRQVG